MKWNRPVLFYKLTHCLALKHVENAIIIYTLNYVSLLKSLLYRTNVNLFLLLLY